MTELILKSEIKQRNLTAFEDEYNKAGRLEGKANENELHVRAAIVAKWYEGDPDIESIDLGDMTGIELGGQMAKITALYFDSLGIVDPN